MSLSQRGIAHLQARASTSSCLRAVTVSRKSVRLVSMASSINDIVREQHAVPMLPYRVGHGFDLHRLEEGYKLIIGGLEIPHTKGCVAHSDGDVLLHTITDAILGALCLPDIGQLFPDNDPKWKGARSDIFLEEAVRLMEEKGYIMGNIDCTIIAQKPKLSPHKENIRNNLCRMLKASQHVVNVKAKTHEKVDSLGEERSIGCHAVVMLIRKDLVPASGASASHPDLISISSGYDLDLR